MATGYGSFIGVDLAQPNSHPIGSYMPQWLPSIADQQNKIMSQMQNAQEYHRRNYYLGENMDRGRSVMFSNPDIQQAYDAMSIQSQDKIRIKASQRYLPGTATWLKDITEQVERSIHERQLEQIRGQILSSPFNTWMEEKKKETDKTELTDELFKVKTFNLNQNN